MSGLPIWRLSACEIAQGIQNKTFSSRDVVEQTLKHVDDVNPKLNAIVDDCRVEALKRADELDELTAKGQSAGVLHGVPVTIKENVDQKGYATPNGVEAFKDIIAISDAPVVRNLKKAGAIIIGRTNTPEFSFRATTDNALHGRTYNPWNDWASAGGSSGGASSAVMSGMGPIAHGNDIGGSLRFPCYCTGATTIKPGLGRVPAYNESAKAERSLLSQLMSVQGVIGREVRDVRLAMQALITYDARDPWMIEAPFDSGQNSGPCKVAFTKNTFGEALHPSVDAALDEARRQLIDAGYQVDTVEPPNMYEIGNLGYRALLGEGKAMLGPDVAKYGSQEIQDLFETYYRLFHPLDGEELLRAMAQRNHYIRQWLAFLQEYPLVLCPFLPTPAFRHNRDVEGDEGAHEVLGAAFYSYSVNFLGLPSGMISPGTMHDDLPVSVQIIGKRFAEDVILQALEAIETRAGVMAHRLFERGK